MPLAVGDVAPDFQLPLKPGEAPLRLADYRGSRRVVLLFFPLAFSGVCTEEMCVVAEDYSTWTGLGAEILGISTDSPFVNQKFAAECNAPFPILSDFNRDAIEAYGVRNDEGSLKGVAYRSVFVVDRAGHIRYVWMSADPDVLPDFRAIKEAVANAS